MVRQVLLLIKPSGVGLEDRLLNMVSKYGRPTQRKAWKHAPMERISALYAEHYGEWYYKPNCDLFRNKPIVTYVLEDIADNPNFVRDVRSVIGSKNPAEAEPGTFRRLIWDEVYKGDPSMGDARVLKTSNQAVDNGAHCSDSGENGLIEEEVIYGNIQAADVARRIGGADPRVVNELVKLSNSRNYIVHGVKDYSLLRLVARDGVAPLSPEGGNASYWSAGWRIFFPIDGSPFFRYAHANSNDRRNHYRMLAAVTSYDLLASKGIVTGQFNPEEEISINNQVPSELISLVNIDLHGKNKSLWKGDKTAVVKAAEKVLLEQLYLVMREFRAGERYDIVRDF